MTVFFAAIGTASDVVAGDFCDLTVTEAVVTGYREGEHGEEIEELGFGGATVLDAVELPVRTDDEDSHLKIEQAAADALEANGWRVVGTWELADNAAYAQVEKADDQDAEEDEAAPAEQVVWSVVEGTSPGSRAVEPEPHGVTIPEEILEWAAGHGLDVENPDVYLLVTTQDEAGEVIGEIAYTQASAPTSEAAAIRQALAEL